LVLNRAGPQESVPIMNLTKVAPIQKPGAKKFAGSRPYVATADVDQWKVKSSQQVRFDSRPTRANVETKSGDVLMARMKDAFKIVLIEAGNEQMIFSTGFVNFRPTKQLDPRFLVYWLMSPEVQALKDALCSGETQKAINNEAIKKHFKIPVPNLDEQLSVVRRCDQIRNAVDRIDKQRTESTLLIAALRESLYDEIQEFETLRGVTNLIYRYPSFYGFKYTNEGVRVVKIGSMTPD